MDGYGVDGGDDGYGDGEYVDDSRGDGDGGRYVGMVWPPSGDEVVPPLLLPPNSPSQVLLFSPFFFFFFYSFLPPPLLSGYPLSQNGRPTLRTPPPASV